MDASLTSEFKAMTPLQKWETLVLSGLIGTSEPWIDDMRKALREQETRLAKPLPIDEGMVERWQPIETAPKGDIIWLSDGGCMRLGYWRNGEEFECHGSKGGGWRDFAQCDSGYPRNLAFAPAYWMPLPPVPQSK